MHPQRNISMIVWDLDNTLIDRDAAFRAFFADWLTLHFPAEDIAQRLAFICKIDRSGDGDRPDFCRQVLKHCGLADSGAADLWELFQRELPCYIALDPRVALLLDSFAEIYPMCVATNGGSVLQRAKVRQAGLDRWFPAERIFVSSEIGACKPERAFFDFLLAATPVAPGESLFVGDHIENDIHGAAAAGMQTCWVSLGRHRPATLPADFLVAQVWELGSLLCPPLLPTA
jgi:putative hydrolase of the HAD superfamily